MITTADPDVRPGCCATRTDGTLWCWGANDFGQLGTGNTAGQEVPQQVTS